MQQIFKIKNINNFTLLRYFIFIIGTINWNITVYLPNGEYKNGVVGNFTIDYLAEKAGISKRSAIEYNKILEKEKLLYIHRQNDFVIDDKNNIKSLSNIYGRASDIEYINAFANNQQKHYESYRYVENNNKKANTKRKLAQMYQQILKGNDKKYSNAEIISVYKYVVSENEKYERMYDKNQYEGYLDKIRDTDVFEKYDFIPNQKEK